MVLLLVAAFVAGVVVVRHSFPQTDGDLALPGLESSVSVLRDDHGIPQIYASSSHDLFYAQGFVQAQDRFFEMDVRRHTTAGRLSELFGEATLDTDKVIRTMGWRRVAEQEVSQAQAQHQGLPAGVQQRRERLHPHAHAVGDVAGVHAAGAAGLTTTRSRTGRRPTRWPG